MGILVSKKQIADFTGRNFNATIRKWVEEKAFPARKIDGVWHSEGELIRWAFLIEFWERDATML